MTMDLRYYNEETGQWEIMFANNTDLSYHIKNKDPHLQPGEREKISNAYPAYTTRAYGVNVDNMKTIGRYALGTNVLGLPLNATEWGELVIGLSQDVVTQTYYDTNGMVWVRTTNSTITYWKPWNKLLMSNGQDIPTITQGLWVPSLINVHTGAEPSYVSRNGEYFKIGNWVYITTTIRCADTRLMGSGGVTIVSLPYVAKDTINTVSSAPSDGPAVISMVVTPTHIDMYRYNGDTIANLKVSDLGVNFGITFSGWYSTTQ